MLDFMKDAARYLSLKVALGVVVTLVAWSLQAQSSERSIGGPSVPIWRELSDTTLERLTTQALRVNNDVRAAQASVRTARLERRLVAFDFAPTVTANSGLVRRRLSATQLPGVSAANREQDVYDAGFDASWEVDVFGRTRNLYKAQNAVAGSADEALRDVQLSLVSEVARTYFELRGAQRQRAVSNRNIVNQRRTLQLTVDRLAAGRGTAFDRERASAQVNTTLAGVTTTDAQIAASTYRLGLLVGGPPQVAPLPTNEANDLDVENAQLLPLPAVPAYESVAPLIQRRPDLRAANQQLEARQLLVNSARADYLPHISVMGSVGYNAGATNTLGQRESSRFAIGPVVSWPAFNLGRVHTRVDAARAQADQTRAQRDQAQLIAQADVQTAIIAYEQAKTRVGLLREAASSSERGAGLARLRFDGGESGFLDVLDAQRTLLDAQERLVRSETEAAIAYIALYKALGGAWAGN